jgi:ribosomal protein L3 glutamine methyltransferase
VEEPEAIRSALDLCTGSGCLAILLAHAFENATVDASDISEDALQVAATNVADYGLENRINLVRSDLFNGLADRRYDLIVSNPPYVNAASMETLPDEYRHEPRGALSSGVDGLDATRAILRGAANHLTENGILVAEIGHNRAELERNFPRTPFTWLETSGGDEFVFLLRRNEIPE